jgi:hypothetical protein
VLGKERRPNVSRRRSGVFLAGPGRSALSDRFYDGLRYLYLGFPFRQNGVGRGEHVVVRLADQPPTAFIRSTRRDDLKSTR